MLLTTIERLVLDEFEHVGHGCRSQLTQATGEHLIGGLHAGQQRTLVGHHELGWDATVEVVPVDVGHAVARRFGTEPTLASAIDVADASVPHIGSHRLGDLIERVEFRHVLDVVPDSHEAAVLDTDEVADVAQVVLAARTVVDSALTEDGVGAVREGCEVVVPQLVHVNVSDVDL